MSRFCENGMKTKRKDCDRPPFTGINFCKQTLHLLRWSEEVVRLHMEEEQDWRFFIAYPLPANTNISDHYAHHQGD